MAAQTEYSSYERVPLIRGSLVPSISPSYQQQKKKSLDFRTKNKNFKILKCTNWRAEITPKFKWVAIEFLEKKKKKKKALTSFFKALPNDNSFGCSGSTTSEVIFGSETKEEQKYPLRKHKFRALEGFCEGVF